jgi:formiminotetrahydrofolate cyclodeaminase
MTEIGIEALKLLATTAEAGTPHALGDLATGGHFLEAMIRGCLENVDANAALMKNLEHRALYEQAAESTRIGLRDAVADLRRALDARASG